jgi:hypothetical protein
MSEPAPYTPATLARIRNGASAADLGWAQERYAIASAISMACASGGVMPKIEKPLSAKECGQVRL